VSPIFLEAEIKVKIEAGRFWHCCCMKRDPMPLSLDPSCLQPDLLGEALARMVPDPSLRDAVTKEEEVLTPSAPLEGPVLEQWVRTVSWVDVDVVVCLGLGTGLAIDLIRTRSQAKILVLEPRAGVIKSVLGSRPMRYSAVDIFSDVIRLRAHLRAYCRFGLRVMLFAPSWARKELADHVSDLEEVIREAHQLTMVNENTERLFGREWTDMILEGLSRLVELVPVNRMYGALKGVPGVVVASGPGLDRNIAVLKQLQGRAAICAMNSSLAALDREGIQPDLLVTVESKDIVNMVARSPSLPHVAFVPGLHSHPKLYELPMHSVLPAVSGHRGVAMWLARHARVFPLSVGGSVSNLAFSILELLGCDPIIMIGQNCALAGERMYAKGTALEDIRYETTAEGAVRMASNEPILRLRAGDQEQEIEPQSGSERMHFTVPAWGGGQVHTMPQLNTYRLWFEEKAYGLAGHRRLINATEEGASIRGFEELSLQQVCDELPGDPVDVLALLDEAQGHADALSGEVLARGLRNEAKACAKALSEARKGRRATKRLLRLILRRRERTAEAGREATKLEEAETALRKLTPSTALLDAYVGRRLGEIQRSAANINTDDPTEGTRLSLEHSLEIFEEIATTAAELEPKLGRIATDLVKQGRNR